MPAKGGAKKLKDKWRLKGWFKIVAPEMFNNAIIGETPADLPEKLVGRVEEVTVQELTGDFTKSHIKLMLKIDHVTGSEARTSFAGHEFTTDYVRRLTRRKRSKIDCTIDVATKDNVRLRVKPMAVADKRVQTSQKNKVRIIMRNVMEEEARTKVLSEFVRDMLSGELCKTISMAVKPIYLLKKIDIRKSEVLKPAEATIEEKGVETSPQVPEQPPTAATPQPETPQPEPAAPESSQPIVGQ